MPVRLWEWGTLPGKETLAGGNIQGVDVSSNKSLASIF